MNYVYTAVISGGYADEIINSMFQPHWLCNKMVSLYSTRITNTCVKLKHWRSNNGFMFGCMLETDCPWKLVVCIRSLFESSALLILCDSLFRHRFGAEIWEQAVGKWNSWFLSRNDYVWNDAFSLIQAKWIWSFVFFHKIVHELR